MFGDGKIKNAIITLLPRVVETQPSMFGGGGIQNYEYDRLMVWCDHGYKSVLEKVKGVFHVSEDNPEPRYIIYIDPRYETKWVWAEIEAVIKIGKPSKKKKEAEFEWDLPNFILGIDRGKKK